MVKAPDCGSGIRGFDSHHSPHLITMKILCFGDSNTYGFNPADKTRFGETERWTGVLQSLLGQKYEVIEEGCNNRTGFVRNPDGRPQSGTDYLPDCLSQLGELDLLILALGTNDLQIQFNIDFQTVEAGLKNLIKLFKAQNPLGNIILIPPVVMDEDVMNGEFYYQFNEISIKKSNEVAKIYIETAKKEKCEFFDINSFTSVSPLDGVHYSSESHKLIAEKLAEFIISLKSSVV